MEADDKSLRDNRVHDAMKYMGVSVVSGCITSLGASFVLFFCSLQFFVVFGIFFFSTILWARPYSHTSASNPRTALAGVSLCAGPS